MARPAASVAAVVTVLALAAGVAQGAACHGRQINSMKAVPCKEGADDVIRVVNVTTRLQDAGSACQLLMSGCVYIAKAIRSSQLSVQVKKGVMQVYRSDDMDGCAMGKQLPIAELIAGPGGDCHHEPGYVCTSPGSSAFDITEYAGMLDMARGKWTATAKLKHDSGKSCIKFNIAIG